MKQSDEFFAGKRYAIFGVKARGRAQGPVLIAALKKAGKTAVAVEPDGGEVKDAGVARSLAEAGQVDGVVLLPPCPWDDSAAEFASDAVRQTKEQGVTLLWIYTAGDASPAVRIAEEEGLYPSAGKCPCLFIAGGGFPHSFHRWIAKHLMRD
jgi:ABC-type branched-subunit amino acid transport system substrate-binding protein